MSQVIIPQVMFFEPIYIPRALNTGTCIRKGDLFYSADLHRNHVLATANTGEIGRGFGENAGEWIGSVEINKKKIPGTKRFIVERTNKAKIRPEEQSEKSGEFFGEFLE